MWGVLALFYGDSVPESSAWGDLQDLSRRCFLLGFDGCA